MILSVVKCYTVLCTPCSFSSPALLYFLPRSSFQGMCSVQLTSSRVRLGQSFKTVGCGCTSCWGDLEAGSVEADVFYIPFIVSVQYIV